MIDQTRANGISFLFPARDSTVGKCLRDHGEFCRAELQFLLDHAGEPGLLLDVGANVGSIALPFARQRPTWKVLAIEAHRGIAGLLAANAINNRLWNVDALHAAAGPERRLAEFPVPPLDGSRNFGMTGFGTEGVPFETVQMMPLDIVAAKNPCLIKIDVEGFETEVLKGARDLLEARRAIWVL
jgi:FkbM family methyltransferase